VEQDVRNPLCRDAEVLDEKFVLKRAVAWRFAREKSECNVRRKMCISSLGVLLTSISSSSSAAALQAVDAAIAPWIWIAASTL